MDKIDNYDNYTALLNSADRNTRLGSLENLLDGVKKGDIKRPETGNDVNNHIHTTYSFSPYSPAKAVWTAYNAGLKTAGIMDHDSISGAREFIQAGEITGMAVTIGLECRADFSATPLNGKRINNPDQKSIAYMALHGIPHTQIDPVDEFFRPFSSERDKRNRLMTERINGIFKGSGASIDYDRDVVPISMKHDGGSITERHLLFALSKKLVQVFGKGESLVDFLRDGIRLNMNAKVTGYLLDTENQYYEYDLLGALKSDLVSMFYIDAEKECPDVKDVIRLCRETGAVSAYAYLGDVGVSVTGDKKAQKFEDDYIEQLFDVISGLGFNAVTYMPSRNTTGQLRTVKRLCEKHGLFQISGEDINSPRQSFVCEAMRNPEFGNLFDSTWALIGHERAATADPGKSMFSPAVTGEYPDLDTRISIYKGIGLTGETDI